MEIDMMYPYMTVSDDTEITHSEMREDGTVEVYYVYFWSNENDPLEPVHVHVYEGKPSANATKVWK